MELSSEENNPLSPGLFRLRYNITLCVDICLVEFPHTVGAHSHESQPTVLGGGRAPPASQIKNSQQKK